MLEAPSGGSLGVKGIQCAVPRPMHGLVPSGASRGRMSIFPTPPRASSVYTARGPELLSLPKPKPPSFSARAWGIEMETGRDGPL